MKKIDVTAFGEVLIDFTLAGINEDGKRLFEENPGGAPANCVCAVSRLGGKTAFLGMTGYDSFADTIEKTLKAQNVNTAGLKKTRQQHTTLAFVSLDENGERHFSFCRKPGADTQLSIKDLDEQLIAESTIFHVGSLSLTDEPAKETTMYAVRKAKESGALISYDPNWRAPLWENHPDALNIIKSIVPFADIIKVSEEELSLLFGESNLEKGAELIMNEGPSIVLITLGSKGVYYRARNVDGKLFAGCVGTRSVQVVDTTGAGDSFTGAFLYRFTRRDNCFAFDEKQLIADLEFANATASICVTRRGAIPALPSLTEVECFLES